MNSFQRCSTASKCRIQSKVKNYDFFFLINFFDGFILFILFSDDSFDDQFLLKSKIKSKLNARKSSQSPDDKNSTVDMQQRLEIIRNKMKSKKAKPSARAIEKKKQKKLKKSKELKKKLISVAKSIKNEKVKEGKVVSTPAATNNNDVDVKPDIKPDIKPAKVFNEEGKMVFSKFEFAAQTSKAKKSKKDSKWSGFAIIF